jgi:hypothetical protein
MLALEIQKKEEIQFETMNFSSSQFSGDMMGTKKH